MQQRQPQQSGLQVCGQRRLAALLAPAALRGELERQALQLGAQAQCCEADGAEGGWVGGVSDGWVTEA